MRTLGVLLNTFAKLFRYLFGLHSTFRLLSKKLRRLLRLRPLNGSGLNLEVR